MALVGKKSPDASSKQDKRDPNGLEIAAPPPLQHLLTDDTIAAADSEYGDNGK